MHSDNRVFFITALGNEAKPLIVHYRLKKHTDIKPFSIYSREGVYLVVTGLGKLAMAAGVAYSQGLFGNSNSILINIGIAGHRFHSVGTPFIGHKIIDSETGRCYYPPLVYSLPCHSETINTASISQLNYDHDYLCDMEASAFYETACRFATGELIQCFKVVSDNQSLPATMLETNNVPGLIAQNMPILETLVIELRHLQTVVSSNHDQQFSELIEKFRLTVTEKSRLKSLLLRWRVIRSNQPLEIDFTAVKTAKHLLKFLEQKLNTMDYYL